MLHQQTQTCHADEGFPSHPSSHFELLYTFCDIFVVVDWCLMFSELYSNIFHFQYNYSNFIIRVLSEAQFLSKYLPEMIEYSCRQQNCIQVFHLPKIEKGK